MLTGCAVDRKHRRQGRGRGFQTRSQKYTRMCGMSQSESQICGRRECDPVSTVYPVEYRMYPASFETRARSPETTAQGEITTTQQEPNGGNPNVVHDGGGRAGSDRYPESDGGGRGNAGVCRRNDVEHNNDDDALLLGSRRRRRFVVLLHDGGDHFPQGGLISIGGGGMGRRTHPLRTEEKEEEEKKRTERHRYNGTHEKTCKRRVGK